MPVSRHKFETAWLKKFTIEILERTKSPNACFFLPSRHTTSFQRPQCVYTTSATSYRHLIDVETMSCVYWV